MLLETPEVNFGAHAADFTLPDARGKVFSRSDVTGPNGLLVAFICNHCPYVVAIAGRLADDIEALKAKGVGTVLINSNDFIAYPQDAPDRMPEFSKKFGLTAPYLIDEEQDIARAYGAVCTPDFFGFDAELKLQYRGRLDDAGRGPIDNRIPELRDAMIDISAGKPAPTSQMPSMGCSLKWR